MRDMWATCGRQRRGEYAAEANRPERNRVLISLLTRVLIRVRVLYSICELSPRRVGLPGTDKR